jgi:glucuronate isomerase
MAFITEDFLLQTHAARSLYHEYARAVPILDFHCHLLPREIAENRSFNNLTEIWLDGDHYKWRAMRADGIAEEFCTGNAAPFEKFRSWARTVPRVLRNPLYHWTHLELARYFGIDDLLSEETAASVWECANRQLEGEEMTVHGILKKFHVSAVCTTDDPTDSLEYHEQISASGISTRVFPTFRPDAAMRTEEPGVFSAWVERLGASANVEITRLSDFLDALRIRHDFFHRHGCRLSDHGLTQCYSAPCGDNEAAALFEKVLAAKGLSADESAKFAGYMLLFFGRLDAEKGWTKQLHLGAYRNVHTRMLHRLGRDVGFDSIGDWPQISALATYMDHLESENALPRMIIFNLNPVDNYVFAALASSFTQEEIRGKVQFGTGWWFLDQKEGIEWQINALSNCGLLSNFVGMVTDSRSFMSFPRHEYFRRVLCNVLGGEMETGLLPNDEKLVGQMVKDICLRNAVSYFRLPQNSVHPEAASTGTASRTQA